MESTRVGGEEHGSTVSPYVELAKENKPRKKTNPGERKMGGKRE